MIPLLPGDRVYIVSGDDAADDPAYGFEPVMVGTPEQVASWLMAQDDIYQLTVWRENNDVLSGRDYLATVIV